VGSTVGTGEGVETAIEVDFDTTSEEGSTRTIVEEGADGETIVFSMAD